MTLAGVDGCRAGWILIRWDGQHYSFDMFPTIKELVDKQPGRVLIDIPIGLGSKGFPRTIEKLMRKELAPRRSTVFNPPVYEALVEADPEIARKINQEVEGKSLSVQTLNICNKIREVDELLSLDPSRPVYECHPELAFKKLNEDQVVLSKKSTSDGLEERLRILEKFEPESRMIYKHILDSTQRKHVKPDDIMDALALCITNKLGSASQLDFLVDEHSVNHQGIEIKIAYFSPS